MKNDIEALKNKILDCFIKIVSQDGFKTCSNKHIITQIAIDLSINPAQIELIFNDPLNEIIKFYFHKQNDTIATKCSGGLLSTTSLTQKVKILLCAKFECLYENEIFAKKLLKFLLLPQNAILAITINATDCDFIWKQTAHNPSNFSYYTKRVSLGVIYSACLAKFAFGSPQVNEMTKFCHNAVDMHINVVNKIKNFGKHFF